MKRREEIYILFKWKPELVWLISEHLFECQIVHIICFKWLSPSRRYKSNGQLDVEILLLCILKYVQKELLVIQLLYLMCPNFAVTISYNYSMSQLPVEKWMDIFQN